MYRVRHERLYKPLGTTILDSGVDSIEGTWSDGYAMHRIRGHKIDWSNGEQTELRVVEAGVFSTSLNGQEYSVHADQDCKHLRWSHGETWSRAADRNGKLVTCPVIEEEEANPVCGRQ